MNSFDLERAIALWRRQYRYRVRFFQEDLDELECHLRDHVAHLQGEGHTPRQAFHEASRALGEGAGAEAEYRKVYWRKLKRHGKRLNELKWQGTMWKNYLKIALRNLRRQKGYSFISITGLAVGLACCLLILLYVQDELSYDRYHENADRTYRLVKGSSANSPERWAPALATEFSDVEHAVRLMGDFSRALVTFGDQRLEEPGGLYADAEVFEVFSWPLLRGDAQTALTAPFSVVLTEPMASSYFGENNPIGQVLTIGGISNDGPQRDYIVTGVMAQVPRASHVHFDYLISMTTVEVLNDAGEWGTPLSWTNRMAKTYLLFREGANPENLTAQLPAFLRRHIADEQYDVTDTRLQPLSAIHLRSNLRSEFEPGGTLTYVYLFSSLALFILLIASINFMNLSTARSQQRAREVGMRKVLGAQRRQIIRQFLGEAILLSLFALGLALIILAGLRPVFNTLTGKTLIVEYLNNGPMFLGFLALALGVGVLAGSYPAFVLSAFKPVRVLKGDAVQPAHGVRLRKGLVVFQFALSIVLIASTLVAYTQIDYLRSKDLGFQVEQVVVMRIGHSEALGSRAEAVKNMLAQHPNIVGVTASHSIPSQWLNGFAYRRTGAAPEEKINLSDVSVDHDFMETFGMEMVAGRAFDSALANDSVAFVLNESAARELGWAVPAEALGEQLEWVFPMGFQGPVIGVVKDFHFGSLHNAIPPIVFHISRFGSNFIAARVRPEGVATTLAFLEATWQSFEPDYPFNYFFVDEQFASLYGTEVRLAKTFGYGAGLAIFIACMGLFGLAAFTVERRRKEIGVRKVLGASVPSVVFLFSKDFLVLVLMAFIVAAPLAYLAMSRWLNHFAYHVDLGVGLFLLAGGLALFIALLTVSYQALRAALADPVKSLRYE